MPYVEPTSRSTGYLVTAADWNQDVVSNVSFLANPPACRVHKGTGTQSFAHGVAQTITFSNEAYDTDTMHDTVTNTDRVTFKTAGLYVITFQVLMAGAADYNFVSASLCKNAVLAAEFADGQAQDLDTSTPPTVTIACTQKFAANDYMTVYIVQNNGAAAARSNLGLSDRSPVLTATWIGRG